MLEEFKTDQKYFANKSGNLDSLKKNNHNY